MDLSSFNQERVWQGLQSVGEFIVEHQGIITFEVVGISAVLIVWHVSKRLKKTPDEQAKVDEMKRQAQLDQLYADKFHDILFEMYFAGEITKKEYRRDCKRFGIGFRLYDLLRPVKARTAIKHKVRRNCAENHKTLQFIQSPPGPKPGEDVPNLPVKRQRKLYVVVGKQKRG